MIVIGLTGSIGMGKSTVAAMFRELGIPVFDADAEVHRLYDRDGAAVAPVAARFPGAVRDGAVDRAALAQAVTGDDAALAALEAIVHPLVRASEKAFLERARGSGARYAVLEIPLLFETGGAARVDVVAVVSAPAGEQRRRVLARPGMSEERLRSIMARQLGDDEKRARADFVIDTGGSLEETEAGVAAMIAMLDARGGRDEGGDNARNRA